MNVRRGAVTGWLARHLPGVPEELRSELVETMEELAGRRGPAARAMELVSLVGLAFTLTARTGTGDDRVESLRQGTRIALLAVTFTLLAQAAATDTAVLMLPLSILAVAVGGGSMGAARLAAIAALVTCFGRVENEILAVAALVVAAAFIARAHDGRRCLTGALSSAVGVGLTISIATTIAEPHVDAVIAAIVALCVFALLAAGWFDPRYAIGAAGLCIARLVGAEPGAFGLGVWKAEPPFSSAQLGLALMFLAVASSVAVAAHSLRWRVGPVTRPHG